MGDIISYDFHIACAVRTFELNLWLSCHRLAPTKAEFNSLLFVRGMPFHIAFYLGNLSVIKYEQTKIVDEYHDARLRSLRKGETPTQKLDNEIPEKLVALLPENWRDNITISFRSSDSTIAEVEGNYISESNLSEFFKKTTYPNRKITRIKHSRLLSFDIPPHVTAQLNPGHYKITVSYSEDELKISKEIEIEIQDNENEQYSDAIDYESAYYFLYNKKISAAFESAQRVIGRNPSYKGYYTYLLLYQLYKNQGNIPSAIRACDDFLHFNKSDNKMIRKAQKIRGQLANK